MLLLQVRTVVSLLVLNRHTDALLFVLLFLHDLFHGKLVLALMHGVGEPVQTVVRADVVEFVGRIANQHSASLVLGGRKLQALKVAPRGGLLLGEFLELRRKLQRRAWLCRKGSHTKTVARGCCSRMVFNNIMTWPYSPSSQ